MNDIKNIIEALIDLKLPSPKVINNILDLAEDILCSEPNVLRLNSPISICGDTHCKAINFLI